MLEHVLEPTLQWSAVLLIHTKAKQSVPLTNVENQTEGMSANSLVKSLSHNVIMLPLYYPTVVKVPVYCSLALKSCIFNCGRSQTSSFCHQRQFFFHFPPPFCALYISIVFLPSPTPHIYCFPPLPPKHYRPYIDPRWTPHRTAFYS